MAEYEDDRRDEIAAGYEHAKAQLAASGFK